MAIKRIANLAVGVSANTSEFSRGLAYLKKEAGQVFDYLKTAAGLAFVGLSAVGGKMFSDMTDVKNKLIRGGSLSAEALQKDMTAVRTVANSIPASLGDIAGTVDAVGDRFRNLSEQDLTNLTTKFLQLAKVAGGTGEALATQLGPVLTKFQINNQDVAKSLDYLAGTAMETGINLGSLVGGLAQYGSTFQKFGYDFRSAVTVMATAEKAGVSVDVLGSALKALYRDFADSGVVNFNNAFNKLIRDIYTAKTATQQTKLLFEAFGRSASEVSDLFTSRFDLRPVGAQMDTFSGTLTNADLSTRTFKDELQMLYNRVATQIVPLFEYFGKLISSTDFSFKEAASTIVIFAFKAASAAVTVMNAWIKVYNWVMKLATALGMAQELQTPVSELVSEKTRQVYASQGVELGFASGGSFRVGSQGARGGIDGVPVSFNADPGEFVSVSRTDPAKGQQGGGTNIAYNITCTSNGVTDADLKQWAVQIQKQTVSQVADEAVRLTPNGRRIRGIK